MQRFTVKLSYSTNGGHKKFVKHSTDGTAGILQSLCELLNNPRIAGYYEDVILQPFWEYNTEAKVICFDGVPICRNPNKKGERSGLNRSKTSELNAFATRVIKELRAICPELIADGILRVDFFGELGPDGNVKRFIVNEIEGFEACLWGVGASAGDDLAAILTKTTAYWKCKVETLIDCHLERKSQIN
jgi:hypothetical protein